MNPDEQARLERLAADPRRTWPVRRDADGLIISDLVDFDDYPGVDPHTAALLHSRDMDLHKSAELRDQRKAKPDLKAVITSKGRSRF